MWAGLRTTGPERMTISEEFRIVVDRDVRYARFSLSPAGNLLVANTLCGSRLTLWDLDSHSKVWEYSHTDYTPSVPSFSPDGKFIADASERREDFWVFDVRTGSLVKRILVDDEFPVEGGLAADFHASCLSLDSKSLIANCCGGTACVSLDDGNYLWRDFGERIESCCESLFLARNNCVVYISPTDQVRVRDATTGQLINQFGVDIQELAVSHCGNLAITLRSDGLVETFKVETGESIHRVQTTYGEWTMLAVSDGRVWLAGARYSNGDDCIVIHDAATGETLATWPLGDLELSHLAFHQHERSQLVCAMDDSTIRILRIST